MLDGHGVRSDSGTADKHTVPLGVRHWTSLGLEHACAGGCGAGGGGDGDGGGGGRDSGAVLLAQMMKPPLVTDPSDDHENVCAALISTLDGPTVPLYRVPPIMT